jgi:hypothetical protein
MQQAGSQADSIISEFASVLLDIGIGPLSPSRALLFVQQNLFCPAASCIRRATVLVMPRYEAKAI